MSLHFMTSILFLGSFTYDTTNYSCQERKTTSISVKSAYHHLWQWFFFFLTHYITKSNTFYKTLTCEDTSSIKYICVWKDICQYDAVNMNHFVQLLLLFNKMKLFKLWTLICALCQTSIWCFENTVLRYVLLLLLWKCKHFLSSFYRHLERKYKLNLSLCNLSSYSALMEGFNLHNLSTLQNNEQSSNLEGAVSQVFSRKGQFAELLLSYRITWNLIILLVSDNFNC